MLGVDTCRVGVMVCLTAYMCSYRFMLGVDTCRTGDGYVTVSLYTYMFMFGVDTCRVGVLA